MFTVSGRVYPISEIDMPRSERPLMVTGCGHIVMQNEAYKEITRPNGRRDYQLLYVRSGTAYYTVGGKEYAVNAGHIVLYHPNEPQFYHYCREDQPDVYWLHFTGGDVPGELDSLELFAQRIYQVKVQAVYDQIFDLIIQELQHKRQYYYIVADARFKELLCRMAREVSAQPGTAAPRTEEVERAVRLFHTQFDQPFNLAQYAASCNMSACWFARLFNRQLGMSPQQYLTDVRITRACEMLSSGSGVAETSEIVGYQDPLYFSRVFKKHTGMSPSQYRKSVSYLL